MRKKLYINIAFVMFLLAGRYSGQEMIMLHHYAAFVNSPPSTATGIPNIDVPLLTVPVGKAKLDFSLKYHPMNKFMDFSEVGGGWSLMGNYQISRKTVENDSEYIYSVPGESGSFYIYKKTDNLSEAIMTAPSSLKIVAEYKDNLVKSFSIVDESGYEYKFERYTERIGYRDSYYITSIKDERQNEVVRYHYDYSSTEQVNAHESILKYLKPSKIVIPRIGEIVFDYSKYTGTNIFKLNTITLNNSSGKQVSKYQFEIINQLLTSLRKYGVNTSDFEKTDFLYNDSENDSQYMVHPDADFYGINGLSDLFIVEPYMVRKPWEVIHGTLKKIILPTGGAIDYEFELHKEYIDKNTANYLADLDADFKIDPSIQYLKYQEEVPFDFMHRCDPDYDPNKLAVSFTVEGNPGERKPFYIKYTCFKRQFPDNPIRMCDAPIGVPLVPQINFSLIKNGSNEEISGKTLAGRSILSFYDMDYQVTALLLTPGTYTYTFSANTGAYGSFLIYEKKTIPGPYKNEQIPIGVGSRIKSIKKYTDRTSLTPKSRIDYEYNDFSNEKKASGYTNIYGEEYINVYKYVTIKNGVDRGYTQYTYKIPPDYMQDNNLQFKYLNLMKYGLLYEEKVFDNNHQIIAETLHRPVIEQTNVILHHFGYSDYMAFVKKEHTTARTFFNGGKQLEVISESERDSSNFNIIHSKITNSDGIMDETFYKYASDKGVAHLINKNIVTTPLETEVKQNGETISKSEVRYEDAGHMYPSYNLSYSLSDFSNPATARKDVNFDVYDEWGNVVQFTTFPNGQGEGFPVTMIWGFNKTQLIAKIEGVKLSQLNATAVDNIVTKSNEYANATADIATKEANYIAALEDFRVNNAPASSQITCYSYYPLIGVSQMIPPNGIKEIYEYDSLNRLKRVKNADGVTIKEMDYHNKP